MGLSGCGLMGQSVFNPHPQRYILIFLYVGWCQVMESGKAILLVMLGFFVDSVKRYLGD